MVSRKRDDGGTIMGQVFFMFMMSMKILVEGGGPVGGPRWEKGGLGGRF